MNTFEFVIFDIIARSATGALAHVTDSEGKVLRSFEK